MSARKKLLIILPISFILTVLLILSIIYKNKLNYDVHVFLYVYVISIGILIFFYFTSFAKLISNLIYAIILISLMLTIKFKQANFIYFYMIIGITLFIFNPLFFIELILKKIIKEKPISYKDLFKSEKYIFYSYRAEMKKMYHLKSRSLYNKNGLYFFLRNFTAYIAYSLGIILTLYEIGNYNNFKALNNYELSFIFYTLFIIFSASNIIKNKSFKSSLRFIYTFITPLTSYFFYLSRKNANQYFLYIFLGLILVVSLYVFIVQFVKYFLRVSYLNYIYFDTRDNSDCYANALYEPYIFEDAYKLVGIYKFQLNNINFKKLYQKMLVYANFHKFFITGYKINKNFIAIYTAFNTNKLNEPRKFLNKISKLFKTDNITLNTIIDYERELYPKVFSNSENYIIQRAVTSAKLLDNLHLKKTFFLSLFYYFEDQYDLINFRNSNSFCLYNYLKEDKILEVKTISKNEPIKLEILIRSIMLNANLNNGKYLRINFSYPSKNLFI